MNDIAIFAAGLGLFGCVSHPGVAGATPGLGPRQDARDGAHGRRRVVGVRKDVPPLHLAIRLPAGHVVVEGHQPYGSRPVVAQAQRA